MGQSQVASSKRLTGTAYINSIYTALDRATVLFLAQILRLRDLLQPTNAWKKHHDVTSNQNRRGMWKPTKCCSKTGQYNILLRSPRNTFQLSFLDSVRRIHELHVTYDVIMLTLLKALSCVTHSPISRKQFHASHLSSSIHILCQYH